jgi:hypothetical protein
MSSRRNLPVGAMTGALPAEPMILKQVPLCSRSEMVTL